MSFQAMTWAVEQELPAMQKIVLLMLANRTNHDTGLCFPSHDTLAKECGMDKRSVIRQIEKLEAAGLLQVNRSTNKPNSYTLNLSSVTKSPSDRVSPLAVTESHLDSDTKSPEPVTNLKRTVVVTREKVFLTFDDLNADEKECWHWAMTVPYWSSSTSSIENFKSVYDKQSPKGLRAQFNAHKKALQDGRGQAGLHVQSNKTKNIGGNYATRDSKSQKLCPADRIKHAIVSQQLAAQRATTGSESLGDNDAINSTSYVCT